MNRENNLDNFDPNNQRDDDRGKNDFFRNRGGFQYTGNNRGNFGGSRRMMIAINVVVIFLNFVMGDHIMEVIEIIEIEIEIIEIIIILHLEVGVIIEDIIGMITAGDIILKGDMIIIIIQIQTMKTEITKEKISIEKMTKKGKF